MIQLTKGTNVLDINLSDFSGAGQDVVQNGSFDDIGSDLILNGDFSEIGSDLVTNGDFSAEGSNLVSNPNFTDGVEGVVGGNFESGLIGTVSEGGAGTVNTWALNTVAPISGTQDGLFAITVSGTNPSYPRLGFDGGLELNKSYVLTFDYKVNSGTCFVGSINRGGGSSGVVSTTLSGSGTYTYYFVAQGNGLLSLNFNGRDYLFNTQFDNVSVKELGADWASQDGDIETYNENGVTITSINTDQFNRLRQDLVTEDGKSYKVTYTIHETSYTAGTILEYYDGVFYTALPEQGVGTHTFYFTRVGTNDNWYFNFDAHISGSLTDFVTISSISVQEVGQDWTLGTGVTIGEDKAVLLNPTAFSFCLTQTVGVTLGKYYKVIYEITDRLSGSIRVRLGSNVGAARSSNGVFEEVIVAQSTLLIFQPTSADFNGSITNITVQEVGQDWSVANSDATQYVEFFGGVGGARIVVADAATSPILTLTANGVTLLAGKSYKLVVDVTVVSGSVKYDVTGTTILFNTTEVKTAYFSPVSDVGLSFYRASSNVDVTFNSVIVQQLDTNNDWNLNTNWVLTDNGALSNGTSNSDINQSKWFPKLGETYKIEYTISLITQGAYKITLGGETTPARDTAGTYIEYVTAIDLSDGGGRLRIRMDNNAIGTISSISVYDIDGLLDIEFTNQLTSKKFDFPNIPVVTTNGRYSSISITPPAETSPPSNATMDEGMYLVTFKLDQLDKVLATRLAFVGSLPAFKEATYDAYKVTDGTAYNVYING